MPASNGQVAVAVHMLNRMIREAKPALRRCSGKFRLHRARNRALSAQLAPWPACPPVRVRIPLIGGTGVILDAGGGVPTAMRECAVNRLVTIMAQTALNH